VVAANSSALVRRNFALVYGPCPAVDVLFWCPASFPPQLVAGLLRDHAARAARHDHRVQPPVALRRPKAKTCRKGTSVRHPDGVAVAGTLLAPRRTKRGPNRAREPGKMHDETVDGGQSVTYHVRPRPIGVCRTTQTFRVSRDVDRPTARSDGPARLQPGTASHVRGGGMDDRERRLTTRVATRSHARRAAARRPRRAGRLCFPPADLLQKCTGSHPEGTGAPTEAR
jgi:hypothetical protein